MQKTLKTAQPAIVKTWCDATGKVFDELGHFTQAPIEVTIEFNYGSQFDEEKITLHYTDKGFQPIFDAIKTNLCKKTKTEIKKLIENDNKSLSLNFLLK